MGFNSSAQAYNPHMNRTPVALKRDTIFECLFEIRFARRNQSADELLPGIVFAGLKRHFTGVDPLPLAQLPKALRERDANLAYQPVQSLVGRNMRLMLGARVATLSFTGQYSGWLNVRPLIEECIRAVLATDIVGPVERCSLKYVNLLTDGKDAQDLGQLDLTLKLNGFPTGGAGTAIRTQFELQGLTAIVDVTTDMTLIPPPDCGKGKGSGVMVNVDMIHAGPFADFAGELPEILDKLHELEKQVFFSLLTKPTLDRLGPIWTRQ
jgi:uncharacterized protein (TIGR04255 family)